MTSDKLKLSLLLLATALPITLATWVFKQSEGQWARGTTNKGELIMPPLDITELAMRDAQGQMLFRTFEDEVAGVDPADYVAPPWRLVYLDDAECDAACEERLYYLRQLHRRLGVDAPRVQRFYLNTAGSAHALDEATQALLAREHPDMEVASADAAELRANLAGSHPEGADPLAEHYIYVVDPVGNVMLYFTPDNTPEEILDDLEKLLSQSSLG